MNQLRLFGDSEISSFDDKRIFGEFNLEKHANLLFPPLKHSHTLLQQKVTHELIPLEFADDPEVRTTYKPYLEIIPPGDGGSRYNTDSHDVLCSLYTQWKKAGKPLGAFKISLRSTATTIGWSAGGAKLAKCKRALESLYSTEVHFKECFEIKTDGGDITKTNTKRFRILARYDTSETVQNGEIKRGDIRVEFSPELLNSLLAGKLIPINVVQRMSIVYDKARAIYALYDTYLNSSVGKELKIVRERRIKNLFKDLTIPVPKYLSGCEMEARKIADQIHGAELSREGLFMHVEAKKTSDGTDWKLIFKVVGVPAKQLNNVLHINNDQDVDDMMASAQEMIGALQNLDTKSIKSLRATMKKTHANIIYSALSELKDELRTNRKPRSVPAYLQGIIKRKVHDSKTC